MDDFPSLYTLKKIYNFENPSRDVWFNDFADTYIRNLPSLVFSTRTQKWNL
jgi:hypothetical protein